MGTAHICHEELLTLISLWVQTVLKNTSSSKVDSAVIGGRLASDFRSINIWMPAWASRFEKLDSVVL